MIIQLETLGHAMALEKALIDFISKTSDNKMAVSVNTPSAFELHKQYETYEQNAKQILKQVNSITHDFGVQPAQRSAEKRDN